MTSSTHAALRRLVCLAAGVAALGATFRWRHPSEALLIDIGASVAVLTVAWERRRALVTVYVTAALVGPLFEAVAIRAGAWSYSKPQLGGFPLWLAPTWGVAGMAVTLYADLAGGRRPGASASADAAGTLEPSPTRSRRRTT